MYFLRVFHMSLGGWGGGGGGMVGIIYIIESEINLVM